MTDIEQPTNNNLPPIIKEDKRKRLKYLDLRILITFVLLLSVSIYSVKVVYNFGEVINFEIQYRNYIKSMNNPTNYQVDLLKNNLTLDKTKIEYNNSEKLVYPKSLKYLFILNFLLLFESTYNVITKYQRFKREDNAI